MHTPDRLRPPSRTTLGLALAGVMVALLTSACSMQQATCGGGEYPVLAVGSAGSACVPDGEEPPKGYARYPEGKVPEHEGDKWDTYWNTRTLDEKGGTIELPDEN
ncbi:SCO0607 family lipoprotein [Streptomyces sp. NPDC057418]|uniref:SCO0607 family lipoprotein n=1 Tax=unclassified Streptomyces TaxID=2593676 RepID=UPI003680055C